MIKTLLKGTIAAGAILYIWMMLSWMALPWHGATLEKFTNEEAVSSAIMANAPQGGIYMLPNLHNEKSSSAQMAEAMKKGPVVFAAIQRNGSDVNSPLLYIRSLIFYLVGAFFVTFMLLQTKPLSYWNKVWFVTAFGIAAGVLASFPNWNWWGFSLGFTLVGFLDFIIGWFLAGLALSAIKK